MERERERDSMKQQETFYEEIGKIKKKDGGGAVKQYMSIPKPMSFYASSLHLCYHKILCGPT